MGKNLLVAVLVFYGILLIGCGKRAAPVDEYQEAVSIEELAATQTTASQPLQEKGQEIVPLPPRGPYKPGAEEIQKALKNANFYSGEIDGKIGPMSEKAIKEFQKTNGLEADGKVGPKTWAALSRYLSQ
ncbi:MAG: peptidoglycan-binding domain-containing protein [Candidatus Omnitrophota bacterium]|nr:peptidoglycan-binding domain-containing protein [Candidatus Omnitrophota bacterium]